MIIRIIFQKINSFLKKCKSKITNELVDVAALAETYLQDLCKNLSIPIIDCNKGELAAFISYGIAFPSDFLALVDTYNVLR